MPIQTNHKTTVHIRPALRLTPETQPATKPLFSRSELRRLVAAMID